MSESDSCVCLGKPVEAQKWTVQYTNTIQTHFCKTKENTREVNMTKMWTDYLSDRPTEHVCSCGRTRLRTARSGLCVWPCWGGIKDYRGVPFCYCITVAVGRRGGCDPQRALLSPLQALLQTHRCILRDTYRHTLSTAGHTRLGRTVWSNEMVWKGLMASER